MLQFNFDPFPELSATRLLLRRITISDANEIFLLRSDKRVMKYIDRPLAQSIDEALEFIQRIKNSLVNNDGITWGITLKKNPKLIGTIGFWRTAREHHRAEIGYVLNAEYHRQGIMQEAMSLVLDYGFKTMKLHSIEANVNPGNAASIKLLERNNFSREAYFKENFFFDGKFLDSAIYSLLTPAG